MLFLIEYPGDHNCNWINSNIITKINLFSNYTKKKKLKIINFYKLNNDIKVGLKIML